MDMRYRLETGHKHSALLSIPAQKCIRPAVSATNLYYHSYRIPREMLFV
jgi:hypothetical protein